MDPRGDPISELNRRVAQCDRYAAIAADFEPGRRKVRERAVDVLADALFQDVANDLVVPRDGVWQVGDRSLVPADRRVSIAASAAVSHCLYFGRTDVQQAVHRFLTS